MTPADHAKEKANTVREAVGRMVAWQEGDSPEFVPVWEWPDVLAALDALESQAETAERLIEVNAAGRAAEEELRGEWLELKAERDAAVQAAEQLTEYKEQADRAYAACYERKDEYMRRMEAAEHAAEHARNALQQLRDRAEREPLAVDISDYSGEYCEGFLAGQANALDAAIARAALAGTDGT